MTSLSDCLAYDIIVRPVCKRLTGAVNIVGHNAIPIKIAPKLAALPRHLAGHCLFWSRSIFERASSLFTVLLVV